MTIDTTHQGECLRDKITERISWKKCFKQGTADKITFITQYALLQASLTSLVLFLLCIQHTIDIQHMCQYSHTTLLLQFTYTPCHIYTSIISAAVDAFDSFITEFQEQGLDSVQLQSQRYHPKRHRLSLTISATESYPSLLVINFCL